MTRLYTLVIGLQTGHPSTYEDPPCDLRGLSFTISHSQGPILPCSPILWLCRMRFGFRNVNRRSTGRPTLGAGTYRRSPYEMQRIRQISGALERVRSLRRQLEGRLAVETR